MKRYILLLLVFTYLTPVWSSEITKPTFYVIGVKNNVKDKEWNDTGIGFGISNLISQFVYDSGEFNPLEKKSEIIETIEKQRVLYWKYKGKLDETEFKEKAEKVQADYVFLGVVKKCKKYKKKAFVGFVSKYQTKIKVFFTLHMIDQKTGKKFVSDGVGFAEKGATGIVFEVIKGKIDFNSTMVGIATREAVKNSVEKLIKKL